MSVDTNLEYTVYINKGYEDEVFIDQMITEDVFIDQVQPSENYLFRQKVVDLEL